MKTKASFRVSHWGRNSLIAAGIVALTLTGIPSSAQAADATLTGVSDNLADTPYPGDNFSEQPIIYDDGEPNDTEPVELYPVKLSDGSIVWAFCVENKSEGPVSPNSFSYQPWSASPRTRDDGSTYPRPVADLSWMAQVNWVINNGAPAKPLAELNAAAGANATQTQAIAATQIAVWYFSDRTTLNAAKADPEVLKIYNYLVNNVGQVAEPATTLSITPDTASGKAGSNIGAYTVHTGSAQDSLAVTVSGAPAGSTVVDTNGAAVQTVSDGAQVYLKVPKDAAAGAATLSLSGETTLPAGTFLRSPDGAGYQSLMLATSAKVQSTVAAAASWQVADTTAPTSTATATTSSAAPTSTSSATTTSSVATTSATTTTSGAVGVTDPADTNAGGEGLANTGVQNAPFLAIGGGILLLGILVVTLTVRSRNRQHKHS